MFFPHIRGIYVRGKLRMAIELNVAKIVALVRQNDQDAVVGNLPLQIHTSTYVRTYIRIYTVYTYMYSIYCIYGTYVRTYVQYIRGFS